MKKIIIIALLVVAANASMCQYYQKSYKKEFIKMKYSTQAGDYASSCMYAKSSQREIINVLGECNLSPKNVLIFENILKISSKLVNSCTK